MATGRKAITFNPAAVSFMTRWLENLPGTSNVINYISIAGFSETGNINGIDPLTNWQNKFFMNTPGQHIYILVGVEKSHKIAPIIYWLKENK